MTYQNREDVMDYEFIRNLKQIDRRTVRAYKKLHRLNPHHTLLRFARITKKGSWIFKKEEIDVVPEYYKEFLEKYQIKDERSDYYATLPMSNYASDLERAVAEAIHE
ncbi:hypothetical protein J4221_07085 [Candidatus Pacearchaeota archaeon]|nr:hypothetical protein [Candidatus Pacearchaeota archaeon]